MRDSANHQTVHLTILSKNTLFSFLGIVHSSQPEVEGVGNPFTAIVKLDPREGQPILKEFTTYPEAIRNYQEAVETSVSRGWSIIYRGQALQG